MASVTSFTLYPAIDLKDGACVRLVRGEMHTATVFGRDPGAQAAAWQAAGFGWTVAPASHDWKTLIANNVPSTEMTPYSDQETSGAPTSHIA